MLLRNDSATAPTPRPAAKPEEHKSFYGLK